MSTSSLCYPHCVKIEILNCCKIPVIYIYATSKNIPMMVPHFSHSLASHSQILSSFIFFLESANLQVLISQLPAYSKPALEMLFFYESTVSNSSCPLSTINNIFLCSLSASFSNAYNCCFKCSSYICNYCLSYTYIYAIYIFNLHICINLFRDSK